MGAGAGDFQKGVESPKEVCKRVSGVSGVTDYHPAVSVSAYSSATCLVPRNSSFGIPPPKVQAASPDVWKPFVDKSLG